MLQTLLLSIVLALPNAATETRDASLDALDRAPGHWRYISVAGQQDANIIGKMVSFSLNAISGSDHIEPPQQVVLPIPGSDKFTEGSLLWINLEDYARKEDLPKLLAAWDRLADDEPYFSIDEIGGSFLTTGAACKLMSGADVLATIPAGTRLQVNRSKDSWYSVSYLGKTGWVHADFVKFAARGRSPVHPTAFAALQLQCLGTKMPIVRGDWLVVQLMTDPPTYYDFCDAPGTIQEYGLKYQVDLGRTLNTTAAKAANIEKRKPTRKAGRVFAFNGPYGLFTLAQDVNDNADRTRNPFRRPGNDFVFDGSEIINIGENGFPKVYLANARGVRVDEVPNNIAPYDYSAGLEAIKAPVAVASSCIICHNQQISERGFKLFHNEQAQALDLIARYDKDTQKLKDLYAKYDTRWAGERMILGGLRAEEACYEATGDSFFTCAANLKRVITDHRDTLVGIETACQELGCEVKQYIEAMKSPYAQQLAALVGDEPYAFLLAKGMRCSRGDWEDTYGFAFQALYYQGY